MGFFSQPLNLEVIISFNGYQYILIRHVTIYVNISMPIKTLISNQEMQYLAVAGNSKIFK